MAGGTVGRLRTRNRRGPKVYVNESLLLPHSVGLQQRGGIQQRQQLVVCPIVDKAVARNDAAESGLGVHTELLSSLKLRTSVEWWSIL